MNCPTLRPSPRRNQPGGFTLVEMMIVTLVGMLVLAVLATLTLFGARSSAAMSNYVDLDHKSRHGVDIISREIRNATRVVGFETNSPVQTLTVSNADQAATVTLTWDSRNGTVSLAKTGQPTETVLTGCDRWSFALYQRTPRVIANDIVYYPATNSAGVLDPSFCKLIDMSWKCSRTIIGQKLNTESVQMAQIVLRNKQ